VSRTIIDVREPFEFATDGVDGAINLPLSQLNVALPASEISVDDELVLYCNSGSRSAQAARVLQAHGYTIIVNGINRATVEQNFC